ncbi:MAG: hydroxyacid dehydrogenase [Nanoarchaeota archaeon]|nr:hydroxyacid dehydrogenase [Nanoarchaeota archaeon]
MKEKILIVDPIHPYAIKELEKKFDVVHQLQPSPEEFKKLIEDANAVVLRSGVKLTKEIIEAGKNLKVIGRAGTGVDNIDIQTAKEKKVKVFNIPSVSSSCVAELTFGLILSIMRKIALANSQLQKNLWKKSELYGNELQGKTIGIVGLGKIGCDVAEIAKGFRMNILASVKNNSEERTKKLKEEGIEVLSTAEILKKADIITLHVPLNDETKDSITKKELELMKNTAYLINMARGGVINEQDLYEALKNKTIQGAASDVFLKEKQENPLFGLENFVATPHIGAMTFESQEKIAKILVENVTNGLEGKEIKNLIC